MRATVKKGASTRDRDGEIEELRARLREAEETLQALREGEIDAVVVNGQAGPQVYTLENADRPYRVIVERMREGALTLSSDGTVLFANRSLGRLLRSSAEAIVGRRFQDFIATPDQDGFVRLLAESQHGGGRGEIELSAGDGTRIPVHLSVVDLPEEGQRIISGTVTDLTQQRQRTGELAESNAKLSAALAQRERAEGQLRQAQKMEAVSQLTAGVAHDFNNLLTVISGNLELIQARVTDVRLKDQVETIQRAIHRGVLLTDQLLAFSRQRALRPRPIPINVLLRDTEPLIRRAVGDEIRVILTLGDAVGRCLVDPAELQASMLNLARNAKDAMARGGSLTIATAEAEADEIPDRALELPPADRYVMVAVTDTGHGMPAEIRERAFDPFFTTKEVGKGTGLGLSQVYGFLRQSGGHVTIESAVGAGTTVRLYLPRTNAAGASESWRHAATAVPASAPETRRVLVVEDDEDVRTFAIELLQDLGYTAVEADSGPMALRLLDGGLAVDVVFSDVRMPDGMSGFQLAQEIRRRQPGTPVVLTSGVAVASDVIGDLPVLRKPFSRDDMLRAIEAALQRGAAAMKA